MRSDAEWRLVSEGGCGAVLAAARRHYPAMPVSLFRMGLEHLPACCLSAEKDKEVKVRHNSWSYVREVGKRGIASVNKVM